MKKLVFGAAAAAMLVRVRRPWRASTAMVGDPTLLIKRLPCWRHQSRFANWSSSGSRRGTVTRSTGRFKSAAKAAGLNQVRWRPGFVTQVHR
jgi:hypothetical protein